jgi:hypothetical protein
MIERLASGGSVKWGSNEENNLQEKLFLFARAFFAAVAFLKALAAVFMLLAAFNKGQQRAIKR